MFKHLNVLCDVIERPKVVVKTETDKHGSFTARCELPGAEDDWTYSWFRDGSSLPFSTDREFSFKINESHIRSSVTCRGERRRDGQKSKISDAVTLISFFTVRPKPVLTVQPEPSQIFRGETVTLTCDLQGEGWTYRWRCDGREQDSKEQELRIKAEITQKCRCYGCRGSDCTDWSDEVTLTVSETPKPVLTVQPEPSQIFRGETVTLTCGIQEEGWRYRWRCGDSKDRNSKEKDGDGKEHNSEEKDGDGKEHNSEEKEFNITAEITQKCKCKGCRGSDSGSDCSSWSDEVTLKVSDKPRVTVKPQSSVFTGDTVTLSCDVRRSTGPRIIWYKDSQLIKSGDEIETLKDVRVSDGGEYWCGVLRENNSTTQGHRVTLTVRERPKAVLRVQPDGRVFRGEPVTLTCDIQETDVTSWTYSWNKDDSEIHISPSQEYRISSVSESHTGHYSCRGRETRGSRHTHTSDEVTLTVSGSPPALIIGVIAGLSVLFLLILLVLLWRCKHNKGGGSPSPSTEHQLHNLTTDQQKKNADAVNELSDVTYAEIDLKPVKEMKKKKKENKGNTSESSDTVYSKLNIQTG